MGGSLCCGHLVTIWSRMSQRAWSRSRRPLDGQQRVEGFNRSVLHVGQHGDPVCKHRAALRERLGALLLDDNPEPPTPAAPAACHNGHGHGWGYGTVAGGRFDRVTCWICGGSGLGPSAVAA